MRHGTAWHNRTQAQAESLASTHRCSIFERRSLFLPAHRPYASIHHIPHLRLQSLDTQGPPFSQLASSTTSPCPLPFGTGVIAPISSTQTSNPAGAAIAAAIGTWPTISHSRRHYAVIGCQLAFLAGRFDSHPLQRNRHVLQHPEEALGRDGMEQGGTRSEELEWT
jgi:hypothetical protein